MAGGWRLGMKVQLRDLASLLHLQALDSATLLDGRRVDSGSSSASFESPLQLRLRCAAAPRLPSTSGRRRGARGPAGLPGRRTGRARNRRLGRAERHGGARLRAAGGLRARMSLGQNTTIRGPQVLSPCFYLPHSILVPIFDPQPYGRQSPEMPSATTDFERGSFACHGHPTTGSVALWKKH